MVHSVEVPEKAGPRHQDVVDPLPLGSRKRVELNGMRPTLIGLARSAVDRAS